MVIKNICFLGAGHVGGPAASVLAFKCPNIKVTVCDINVQKISQWNSEKLPIFEPDLDNIVKLRRNKNLFFTTDTATNILEAELIFITVKTPLKTSGFKKGKAPNLQYLEEAARTIAKVSQSNKIIVEKSTVPVRAAESVAKIIHANKKDGISYQILSNPEFSAEGSAIHDLLHPDRVLIGGEDDPDSLAAIAELCAIYENWIPKQKIIITNTWSSELSKLAANAMLAQRISSINALSAVCEAAGADVTQVANALGTDSRIGSKFLQAFIGFGGRCFKKDILNLVYICECLNLPEVATYWQHVLDMNEYQKNRFTQKILQAFHNTLNDKRIALFGFAFKKNTMDTIESPAIDIAKALLEEGAHIHIYDPKVEEAQILKDLSISNSSGNAQSVTVFPDPYTAAKETHAIVVCTGWEVFATLNYKKIYDTMLKPAYIFDGGKILDYYELVNIGFQVETIGKTN